MTDEWDDTVAALPGSIDAVDGPGQAYLVVVRGAEVGETYPVIGPDMVIGRGAGADLRLNDEGVSRFHCRLRHQGSAIVIEDLGSRNGTYCNGERIVPGMRALVEGDRLQIGTTIVLRFTYVDVSPEMPTISGEQSVIRDPLTRTHSRRYFVSQLESEVTHALGHRSPLCLLLIHIDRYSELCELQGQPFADQLTVRVADHIRDNIREDHIVARIAAGEFALMSRSVSSGTMFMLAERLRKTIPSPTQDKPFKFTLSIGLAAMSELRIETAHDLLVAAGSALHRARSQAGNRVVLCTQDLLHEPKNRTRV